MAPAQVHVLSALLRDLPPSDLLAVRGAVDRAVGSVTRDSRHAGAGAVFVAVAGAHVDGHALVPGLRCAAVVVEREVEAAEGVTVVRVASTRRALAHLAAALHGHPARALQVVGVTGTNGKTTVTTLLEQACRTAGVRVGRIGTTGLSVAGEPFPTSFTTPEAPELQAALAEMVARGCRHVFAEASSIGLAQHRVDAIPFAVGVFTNLTRDHLDFHGTMEAYRAAKARLFTELLRPVGGPPRALLCADDPTWSRLEAPPDRWTFGTDLADVVVGPDGAARTPHGDAPLRSALVGRHNRQNLAAALGVLLLLGYPLSDAARWLAEAPGAPGRLERVADPGGRLVLVDYAHSDDALANVLPAARELTGGRLVVVFGAGGDRDRGKRPRMGAVAERLADLVVLTSDNPRSEDPAAITADIAAGMSSAPLIVLDRADAIRRALAETTAGDVVVIAGKGHETYQEVAGVRHPFDDRAVAAALAAERAAEER